MVCICNYPQGPAWDIGAYEYNQFTVKKPSPLSSNLKETFANGFYWTQYAGKTYTYALQPIKYAGKTVSKVTQDGAALVQQGSVDLCESAKGSYYFNASDGTLYVHSADDADPDTHGIDVYYH